MATISVVIITKNEAANIADWVIEYITGVKRIDRILNKQIPLTHQQEQLLERFSLDLLQHKPIQYVLHEAWFAGMKLYVDENVLIPRPETEELVEWVVKEVSGLQFPVFGLKVTDANSKFKISNLQLLDIGTGSGCIPIALKKKISSAFISAIDISAAALEVAKRNAAEQQTEIMFRQLDILNRDEWKQLSQFDIIVSNPPYIKQNEAGQMHSNVLEHEPHLALFVPNDDALLFYKTIAAFGLKHLNKNGKLFFEINETLGNDVCELLQQYGYKNIELKKDMQGKERMIKAILQ